MLILGCKGLKADTCSLLLKVNGSVFHAIIRSFNSQPYNLELTFILPLFIGCEYHKKTNKQTNKHKNKTSVSLITKQCITLAPGTFELIRKAFCLKEKIHRKCYKKKVVEDT